MKINVDIDCTPTEARTFLGLPDLAPLHEAYLEQMKRAVSDGITPDMVESLLRNWAPFGDAGMSMWRQMFDHKAGTPDK